MMIHRFLFIILIALLLFLTYCTRDVAILPPVPEGAQAISLSGDPLYSETPSEKVITDYEAAQSVYDSDRESAENIIWLGRRAAYTGDYREAVRIFTRGLARFPDDARFFRHRGHRYISIREFDRAIADFRRAAILIEGKEDEIEPDGMPNALNIPVSTLHTNIWYHLGLAYYLKNDLLNAMKAYRACLDASKNDDMLVATCHWLYMTLRRLEWEEQADSVLELIDADMNIIENEAYYRLLLFYKGDLTEKDITSSGDTAIMSDAAAYGLGNWFLYNGETDKARDVFESILAGDTWASFGYIAAEADIARGLNK